MTKLNEIETTTHKLATGYIFTVQIEKYDDSGIYSVVAYDDYSGFEGGLWIEKFADSYTEAHEIAEKLAKNIMARN